MKVKKQSGAKPFVIPKKLIFEAYKKVKANKGIAGIDDQSISQFEENLEDNLYKLWNRLSSGTHFPPPVKVVEIPKQDGSKRTLGIPTVADRIAQTAVAMLLEPELEEIFHEDSYGYRAGKSAIDAIGIARQRCWNYDWVIDLDIAAFFDSVPHDLILEMVRRHTNERWVMICIERWLVAQMQNADGTLTDRDKGTHQGSAISPTLANIFLHYVFDTWMEREFPSIPFERFADDVICHCKSKSQAEYVLSKIATQMESVGMKLHPDKTKIVYCKDDRRRSSHENHSFSFCGYTFKPRRAKSKKGKTFIGFLPAAGNKPARTIRQKVKSAKITKRSDRELEDIAEIINPLVRGQINYYGKYYPSKLKQVLNYINVALVKWAMRKYKRLRYSKRKAWRWLAGVISRQPNLFAHWSYGVKPPS